MQIAVTATEARVAGVGGEVPLPDDPVTGLGARRESRARRGPHPLDNSPTGAAGHGLGWTEGLRRPSAPLHLRRCGLRRPDSRGVHCVPC